MIYLKELILSRLPFVKSKNTVKGSDFDLVIKKKSIEELEVVPEVSFDKVQQFGQSITPDQARLLEQRTVESRAWYVLIDLYRSKSGLRGYARPDEETILTALGQVYAERYPQTRNDEEIFKKIQEIDKKASTWVKDNYPSLG